MIRRLTNSPILSLEQVIPSDPRLKVAGIFNLAACLYHNEILLLARVAEICSPAQGEINVPIFNPLSGKVKVSKWHEGDNTSKDPRLFQIKNRTYLSSISHLRLARSIDGVHFSADPEPFIFPHSSNESFGVEDARITQIGDTFYITYTAVSENGFGAALASTKNFKEITRHGMILPPQNKDACLFPEKIDNRYVIFHRPLVEFLGNPSIWMADSPDLFHWGNHKFLMSSQKNAWEVGKIGAGPAPIRTDEGWLLLYHAVDGKERYTLHLALLDLENPHKVLKRTSRPIFQPELPWEREGFFAEVVFSNGWVVFPDGRVLIYYGGADSAIGVAESSSQDLLTLLND